MSGHKPPLGANSRWMTLILAVALSVSVFCLSVQAATPYVLVVESYHAGYPWDAAWKKGLADTIGPKAELRFFEMDTKRLPPAGHPARADEAWELIRRTKPALVVLGDDAALKLLGPRLEAAAIPSVYLGVNANPRSYVNNPRHITGVLERPIYKRDIVVIREILGPGLKKLLILLDTDTTALVIAGESFGGQMGFEAGGVEVAVRLIGDLASWREAVLTARDKGYGAVIVGLYQTIRDESGAHVNPEELMQWTSRGAPVPLFAFWDFAVGSEATAGGLVLAGEEQGRAAGEVVLKILAGAGPSSILPVTPEQGRLLFSRSQLAKWKLSLPAHVEAKAEFVP